MKHDKNNFKSFILLGLLILSVYGIKAQCVAYQNSPVYKELSNKYDRYVEIKDTFYIIRSGGYKGVANCTGKVIIPPTKYTNVSLSSKGYWEVKIGSQQGIVNIKGQEIIAPGRYSAIGYWYNDHFEVYKNGKKGWVDANGVEIIPTKYTEIHKEQRLDKTIYYRVSLNQKEGILDADRKEMLSPIYDDVSHFDSIIQVEKDGKQGLMTPEGKWMIKPIYRLGEHPFGENYRKEGLISFQDAKTGLWGFLETMTGNIVIPAQYTSVEEFKNGVAKVSNSTESFLITNPLKNKGVSKTLSGISLSNKSQSDIDLNIPQTNNVQENTFAVIIANQEYSDFSVRYASNDGYVIKEYFSKCLGIPSTNIIYHTNATLNNIKSALSRISDIAEAYDGDAKVLFYFVGQGVSDNKHNCYLMPSDGSLELIQSTCYSLEKMYSILGEMNVQSTIVMLDCSFNNTDREGKPLKNNISIDAKAKTVPFKGKLITLQASSQGESVFVNADKGHGLFTYYLCKKLQTSLGKSKVDEIAAYIGKNVPNDSLRKFKTKQNPQLIVSPEYQTKNIKL